MGIRTALVPILAGALFLTGCSAAETQPGASGGPGVVGEAGTPGASAAPSSALAQLADLGIDTSDPVSIVDGLDALPVAERPTPQDLLASVQPDALVLQPGDVSLPLADAGFYLSIAPYVEQTHPCEFHSLTTCLGELQNTPVEVTVTDSASGEVVHAARTSTADNGFVGVWLPRDRQLDVRVAGAAGSAVQRVTTGENDPTCLTTLRLTA